MTKVKILECDTPNLNGHIYPKDVVEKAMIQFQGLIDRRAAMITKTDSNKRSTEPGINLNDVCGIVKSIELVDNEVFADIVFIDTPKGKWLKVVPIENMRFSAKMMMWKNHTTGEIEKLEIHSIEIISKD